MAAKKTKSDTTSFYETVQQINWKAVPHGTYFVGYRHRTKTPCVGRVSNAKGVICLNGDFGSGIDADADFGLPSYIGLGTTKDTNVSLNFTVNEYFNRIELFHELPKDYSLPKTFVVAGRKVTFNKGSIKVGCETIPNSVVRQLTEKLLD